MDISHLNLMNRKRLARGVGASEINSQFREAWLAEEHLIESGLENTP